ncbi:hypothetical protein BDV33DRAFT_210722 [Aspergillus novoparasiticus]|uniref:Uncharacterized protein n=1 Tax=Aspergillus novoparasiticus TaxID=986946 RepID=A0A5N6E5R7_9EURO|nr:hypothetical protein BDV33DRAFT_210722 [Aspergillus novoparasiticus]
MSLPGLENLVHFDHRVGNDDDFNPSREIPPMAWLEEELEAMEPHIHTQSSSSHHSALTDHPSEIAEYSAKPEDQQNKGTAAMNIPQCYEQQSHRNKSHSRFARGGSRRSRRRPVRPDLVDFVACKEELSAQLQEAKLRRRENHRHRTTKEYMALSKEIDQLQAILQRQQRGCRK